MCSITWFALLGGGAVLLLCLSHAIATTTDASVTDGILSTVVTAADDENTTPPAEMVNSTREKNDSSTKKPFTIRVAPMAIEGREAFDAELLPYADVVSKEGDLQDIGAEESSNHNKVLLRFGSNPGAQKPNGGRQVEVTSYVADSDTALDMDVKEALADVRNISRGADMISAFFVAPEDEVYGSNLLRKRLVQERKDVQRPERYSHSESSPSYKSQNSLTNEILAPLQAGVSLSHGHSEEQQPMIEKQTLREMPVYKTTIEIQKAIPYEIKGNQMMPIDETEQQRQHAPSSYPHTPVQPQLVLAYPVSHYRTPLLAYPSHYRYPAMYYIPQGYVGNYIMKHSHENTGVPAYSYKPKNYYYWKYQPPLGSYYAQGQSYQAPYPTAYAPSASDVQDPHHHSYQQVAPQVPQVPQVPHYQDIGAVPLPYPDVKGVPAGYNTVPVIYHTVKSVPPEYEEENSVSNNQDDKPQQQENNDVSNEQVSYQDDNAEYDERENTNDYKKENQGAYQNEHPIAAAYTAQKEDEPASSYQQVSDHTVPDYQNIKVVPVVQKPEPRPLPPGAYQEIKSVPLAYHTIKAVPAYQVLRGFPGAYPDIKGGIPGPYPDLTYYGGGYAEQDQNSLHSEPAPKVVAKGVTKLSPVPQHPNQLGGHPLRSSAPFRPSQSVYSSVYPPYTYRVPFLLTTKGRGIHARSIKSKQLCIEYGGFKPPMIPSVQIDESELPQENKETSAVQEETKKS